MIESSLTSAVAFTACHQTVTSSDDRSTPQAPVSKMTSNVKRQHTDSGLGGHMLDRVRPQSLQEAERAFIHCVN